MVDFNADDSSETNTGQFIIALDVARFLPVDVFAAEVARHLDDLRHSERLPGADPIRMPGDQRAARRAERAQHGVPLAAPLVAQLDKLAGELGIKRISERGPM